MKPLVADRGFVKFGDGRSWVNDPRLQLYRITNGAGFVSAIE